MVTEQFNVIKPLSTVKMQFVNESFKIAAKIVNKIMPICLQLTNKYYYAGQTTLT